MYRIILVLLLMSIQSFAQTPRKPLSRTINRPSDHQIAPCISGDGKTIIYMSTYSESGDLEVKTSTQQRGGSWTDPEDIKILNQWTSNNYQGGYFLSYDGNTIVFTSRKVPGIGKFDIWITEKRGNNWSAPVNLGKPVNSVSNEGSPSLSPDGKKLYFMRCEKMTTNSAESCQLMVAERRGKYWNEPVKLPAPINLGHETSPRILGDNQSLIFSSNRPGGKGKLDYYLTRFENGEWLKPVAMDYLNTPENDEFVSIPLRGNIAYYSMMYRGYQTIIKAQIPEELQPRKVMLLDGSALVGQEPAEVFLQVYDLESGELIQHGSNEADGKFHLILAEGKNYDFSATPKNSKYLYYAKIYELEDMETSSRLRPEIVLKRLEKGLQWSNRNIEFIPGTADLKGTSDLELKRLIKLLKNNPGLNLSMEIYTDEVIEDTVRSDPDLTEIRKDTIEYEIDSIVFDTLWLELDSLGLSGQTNPDSVVSETMEEAGTFATDSSYTIDTLTYPVIRQRVIDVYHNDRTSRQAETLDAYFNSKGVPEDRFLILGLGDINKLAENDSEENRALNRRIEVIIE